MGWSPQQDRALRDVSRWLDNPGQQQIFRLFGYAGTGKTTLAKHLAEDVHGEVLFAAFTGKAASVLKANGAPNAQTLHSLIYLPKGKSLERLRELESELEGRQVMYQEARYEMGEDWEGNPEWDARIDQLKKEIQAETVNAERMDWTLNLESPLRNASLLVVDECSMVDEEMAQDILSFNTPVLVLGDPAQLPPIRGTGFFTDAEPDAALTEIHRQAKGNPIIEMATRVREGQNLRPGVYGTSSVITRATPELALEADQILVGRNRTRLSTNRRVRELKGFAGSPFPLTDEKLVCLRNDRTLGLLNGTIHYVLEDSEELGGFINLRIKAEDDGLRNIVSAHPEHFDGDPDTIGYWNRRDAQEFTFGYALTTHKAQGSQWKNVLVIDESDCFKGDTPKRWLYTAITRAQERITLVV